MAERRNYGITELRVFGEIPSPAFAATSDATVRRLFPPALPPTGICPRCATDPATPPRLAAHEHFGPTAERLPSTGNWRNDHPRQHRVHIVGRHHQAGAFFLDFCADGEVKIHPRHRAAPCLQLSPDPLRATFLHRPVAPHILVSRCVVTREPCRAGIDSASLGCSRYRGNTLRFRRHRRLLRTGGLAHIPCCPPAHANWRR